MLNFNLLTLLNQSGPKNFGFIHENIRTPTQNQINFDLIAQMPTFQLIGSGYWKAGQRSPIYDCVKKLNNGQHLKPLNQQVGSCVGHGKAKAEWYLSYVQNILLGKLEAPTLPYEPYGYAQSRVCGGLSGYDDGSFGSAAAEAARIYGVLDSGLKDLPAFKINEQDIIFSGQVDRDWGNRGAPQIWIPEGKKHLVKTTAQIKSVDDAVAALANGYPITIASDWGGLMDPPVKGGNNPVRLNRRADTWFHQMMVSDFWDHPELGLIFHIDNSWGTSHGQPVSDSPVGGFWVQKGDLSYIIAQKEAFAFSDMEGFPERRIDQALLMLI